MSEGESERACAAAAPARGARGQQEEPVTPGSASSERPAVSGLGLSGSSRSSEQEISGGAAPSPPPVEGVQGRRVQDRLEWLVPKMSRKAKWRRRQSLRRQQAVGQPGARPVLQVPQAGAPEALVLE
jgi:hypothetical protein